MGRGFHPPVGVPGPGASRLPGPSRRPRRTNGQKLQRCVPGGGARAWPRIRTPSGPRKRALRWKLSGHYGKCWPFRQDRRPCPAPRSHFRAPRPRVPRPTIPRVHCPPSPPFLPQTWTRQIRPAPGRKCRETFVRPPDPVPAAPGIRSAHAGPRRARRGRTAGGAGVPGAPSRRSPCRGRAVSRELGVNSPEWRREACLPRRRRYPGPPGPELEAAAGRLGGDSLPGAPLPTGRPVQPPARRRPRGRGCAPAGAGASLRLWTLRERHWGSGRGTDGKTGGRVDWRFPAPETARAGVLGGLRLGGPARPFLRVHAGS